MQVSIMTVDSEANQRPSVQTHLHIAFRNYDVWIQYNLDILLNTDSLHKPIT